MNVRLHESQQPFNRRVAKNNYVVHAAKRGDELSTVLVGHDRLSRSLEALHRSIVVHRHNEPVGFSGSSFEVPRVAYMKQIKAAVRKRDRSAFGPIARHRSHEFTFGNDVSQYPIPGCDLEPLPPAPEPRPLTSNPRSPPL